jgi:hypothetical protein
MKPINFLLTFLFASTVVFAQQPAPAKRVPCGRACTRRVLKTAPSATPAATPPVPAEFSVGEARVDVTKDETVVKLAMAQHGSVLIELPANDGPRYIIPGDPEMATVDQKALERNKRAIVVRPGEQFVPPLRNIKARTPAATVTAQMRSGLVVTFLFYPVEDLAQNVHRCVLSYSRDEVVARRRAAGLPVNLDGGEMTVQPAAPISISVEGPAEEKTNTKEGGADPPAASSEAKPVGKSDNSPQVLPSLAANSVPPTLEKKKETKNDVVAVSAREALQAALKQPKQFKNWTKPLHGLSLSLLQPPLSAAGFNIVVVAVRNKSNDSLKLSPGVPDLSIEMLDEHGKAVNIETIKKLATEAGDPAGVIPAGATSYYALAYVSPALNSRQRVKLTVGQTNAADRPASIALATGGR